MEINLLPPMFDDRLVDDPVLDIFRDAEATPRYTPPGPDTQSLTWAELLDVGAEDAAFDAAMTGNEAFRALEVIKEREAARALRAPLHR